MAYDIVFYMPSHKAKALNIVKRLPQEEIDDRQLHLTHGLRFWFGIPMPKPDGLFDMQSEGRCVCRNFLGSVIVGPGKCESDPTGKRMWLKRHLSLLEEVEPGLVGGNFLPTLFDGDEFKREFSNHQASDEHRLQQLEDSSKQDTESELIDYLCRYRRMVGLLVGVQQPDSLSLQDTGDLAVLLRMQGRQIPEAMEFITQLGYSPEAERVFVMSEDPEAEALNALSSMQAPDKVVTRKTNGSR